jgi:hypothetical protein
VHALSGCSSSSSGGSTAVERKPIYCSNLGEARCDCGPGVAGSLTQACSAASIGAPSVCCAESGFVTAGNGMCSCASLVCSHFITTLGEVCECGAGVILNGAPVSSCVAQKPTTPFDGGAPPALCCLSQTRASCSCNSDTARCADAGGSVVSTCTADMLAQTCDALFPGYSQTLTDCRAND